MNRTFFFTSIHDMLCCCISSILSLTMAYSLLSNFSDCRWFMYLKNPPFYVWYLIIIYHHSLSLSLLTFRQKVGIILVGRCPYRLILPSVRFNSLLSELPITPRSIAPFVNLPIAIEEISLERRPRLFLALTILFSLVLVISTVFTSVTTW